MRNHRPKERLQEDPLLEWLAWLMDESIPIGPWKIGLDGLLGLIPGVGDMAGAGVSVLLIGRAMQAGISRSAVTRMVINVATDSLIGSLPFVGDLFDFAYKANIRNLEIYREALRGERRPIKDWSFILVVAVILLIALSLPLIGLIYLARFLSPYLPTF
jgi:hypothetical protein